MNNLSTIINDTTLINTITRALKEGRINQKRYDELHSELDDFTYELTLIYNHRSSSSLHQTQFLNVLDTINFVFMNAYKSGKYNLNIHSVKEYFYYGFELLEVETNTISDLFKKVQKRRLPFNNDRYLSIINQQIPNYLNSLTNYHAWFNYCKVEDDLDYPLVNGLPLDHHMYHLQGSNLVLFYLRNFHIENEFCCNYINEIPELIKHYEVQKGVEVELLNINIFEMVLTQLLANTVLGNPNQILLSLTDYQRLQSICTSSNDLSKLLETNLNALCRSIGKEQCEYILEHKQYLIDHLSTSIQSQSETFIYEQPSKQYKKIVLTHGKTNTEYSIIMHRLQCIESAADKIHFINSSNLSLFDLIDLFDDCMFSESELLQFFTQLPSINIAVFLKYLDLDIDSFHTYVTINQVLATFTPTRNWEFALIEYLTNIDFHRKEAIESEFDQIQLTYLI